MHILRVIVIVLTPCGLALTFVVAFLASTTPVHVLAATPSTLNFQARLESSSGAIVADGNYNIEFKLYNVSSAGTAEWTEDYLNSASQGVHVANGYLSVNLGSITAFPGTINWDQQQYLTMNIGGVTTGSVTWDGEMNPRIPLTGVPYAFDSGMLGGLTASQFGQLAANNTWTGANDIQNTSSAALEVQKASGGAAVLTVNTSSNNVTLGSNTELALQGTAAYITNPQGQTNSEAFGANAVVSGADSLSLGEGSTSGSSNDVTIGQASSSGGANSITIGEAATTTGSYAAAIGASSNAVAGAFALGGGANAFGTNSVAIGGGAQTGGNAIAIGNSANANGNSIVLGASAASTGANQLVVGGPYSSGSGGYISNAYLGSGITDTSPQNITINATGGSGTNVAGANLNFASGIGTGSANGGNINFEIANPGASGSSANALHTVMSVDGSNGAVTLKNAVDSTSGLVVSDQSGRWPLSVDTSHDIVSTVGGALNVYGIANVSTPTLTTLSTGGSLPAGTYYYAVDAENASGYLTQIAYSNPTNVVTTGSTSKNTLTWTGVQDASSYDVFRSSDGATWYTVNVSAATTSLVDNGSTYTWGTRGYPDLYANGTGGINVQAGSQIQLDGGVGAGNSFLSYDVNDNTTVLNNGNANGGVLIQGSSFAYMDTTTYTNDLYMDSSGATIFHNSANSTSGFTVENVANNPILNVDTTNQRVGIDSSSPGYALDVTGDTNTSGVYRIAGSTMLQLVGTGNDLVGGAGNSAISGSSNVAMGAGALNSATSGSYNFALGGNSLYGVTSGSGNIAIGIDSLQNSNTGIDNVGLGQNAGYQLSGGSNGNILIGYYSGSNLTSGSNNIIIATPSTNAPTATTSNYLNIGNVLYGDTSAGTGYLQATSTTAFQVRNSGGTAILNVDTSGKELTVTGNASTSSTPTISTSAGWEWDTANTESSGTMGLTVAPHNVGDILIVVGGIATTGQTVTGLSGGGVSSWTKVTSINDTSNPNYDYQSLWEGKVTTTGSTTLTASYSTTGLWAELMAQEFTTGQGSGTSWTVSSSGTSSGSVTAVTYPSLTASQNGQMYWGYGDCTNGGGAGGSAGSTPGFTYLLTTNGKNPIAYDTNLSSGNAYAPTATCSSAGYTGIAAIISAGSTLTSSTSLHVNNGDTVLSNTSNTALNVQDSSGNQALTVGTNNLTAIDATTRNTAAVLTLGKITGGDSIAAEGAVASSLGDYAEYFPQTIPGQLQPGEVACLDTSGAVEPCNAANTTTTLTGVVSTAPGFVGNNQIHEAANPDATALVSMLGQVPVKVSTANGAINVGDELTMSSMSGVAVKASGAGMVIGTALESYTGSGTGEVQLYIHISFYDGLALQSNGLDSGYVLQGDAANLSALTVNGDTTLNTLTVETSATIPTLTVTTSLKTVELVVSGTDSAFATLHMNDAHFEATQTAAPTISSVSNCGAGSDSDAPAQDLTSGSTDGAGSFYVQTGSSGTPSTCQVTITFNKSYGTAPKTIILTPDDSMGGTTPSTSVVGTISAKAPDGSGFTFQLGSTPAAGKIRYGFDYWVVQ